MFGIPTEIITGLGAALLGGALQIWARAAEAKQRTRAHELDIMQARAGHMRTAREYEGPAKSTGFHFTRRAIALMVVFFVLCWPKIVAVFTEIPVAVSYTLLRPGVWFWPGAESVEWVVMSGLVVTPLDSHVTLAIIGMFFGSEISKRQ